MKSLDLNLLATLDVLSDSGSVSGAAQRMHLSTPAMSHALARIREALGDPILVRAGRKLVPTPRAIEMREPLRRLVVEAKNLMQPMNGVDLTTMQRDFVIRAPDGIAIVYGAALLEALQKKMPLATLKFVPESEVDLTATREGRIDLDIGTVHDRSPELQTTTLYAQRIVGAARSGHPLLKPRLTIEKFQLQSHVAIVQRADVLETVDAALSVAGFARRTALSVPSAYGALMAAATSSMIACVPEPLARAVAQGLGLTLFELPIVIPTESIVQAWHPRLANDLSHQWLRECVVALVNDTRQKRASSGDTLLGSRHEELFRLGMTTRNGSPSAAR
jgi:DNA-binding transcriptional LysR family regulator